MENSAFQITPRIWLTGDFLMDKWNLKKKTQLGMSFGAASHRLRRSMMFALLCETKRNICYRCKKSIDSPDEVSMDHKTDWLNQPNAKELFFDTSNIEFSHKKCNTMASLDKRTSHRNTAHMRRYKARPYAARLWNGVKQIHIGYFATREEAAAVAMDAKQKHLIARAISGQAA